MGKLLKIFSIVYIPMCTSFFISEQFDMPHIMVILFWITMLLSGIVYEKIPTLDNSYWSVAHFWCHSIGLPLTIASFLGFSLGNRGLIQVFLALGSYPLLLCVVILFIRIIGHYVKTWKSILH